VQDAPATLASIASSATCYLQVVEGVRAALQQLPPPPPPFFDFRIAPSWAERLMTLLAPPSSSWSVSRRCTRLATSAACKRRGAAIGFLTSGRSSPDPPRNARLPPVSKQRSQLPARLYSLPLTLHTASLRPNSSGRQCILQSSLKSLRRPRRRQTRPKCGTIVSCECCLNPLRVVWARQQAQSPKQRKQFFQ